MTMIITSVAGAWAAAPHREKVEYKGSGKVEFEFREDVDYNNVSVAVKDSSGKSYSTKILEKDDDEIKFRINDYKKGTTYNITVSGVRQEGTSSYGEVTGKVKIPAASKSISRKKAIKIAKNHAKKKWNAKSFIDVDAEKDTYKGKAVWEVDFEATSGGRNYEYEYKIQRSNGKILKYHRERD